MPHNTPPAVLITGVSGSLGTRLLCELANFRVVGVDLARRSTPERVDFESVDLSSSDSSAQLADILHRSGSTAVVHLAFVLDPLRTGILDKQRMWQINVAGAVRVMEAISQVNRAGGAIEKFIFASSVSVYGPDLPYPVREDYPLGAHTLTYALHKRAADELVRSNWQSLGDCSTYVLRPHIFTGPTVENYQIGALRGTPGGNSKLAARLRRQRIRLPIVIPRDRKYLENKFQFVHVDDVARLIAFILGVPEPEPRLTVLNVAARGEPLPLRKCAEVGASKIVRLPGRLLCRLLVQLMWSLGISSIPPDAAPYLVGSYTMDTSRLREFLGDNYERVIRYTVREALEAAFQKDVPAVQPRAVAV